MLHVALLEHFILRDECFEFLPIFSFGSFFDFIVIHHHICFQFVIDSLDISIHSFTIDTAAESGLGVSFNAVSSLWITFCCTLRKRKNKQD